jgi:hypothetical protein
MGRIHTPPHPVSDIQQKALMGDDWQIITLDMSYETSLSKQARTLSPLREKADVQQNSSGAAIGDKLRK